MNKRLIFSGQPFYTFLTDAFGFEPVVSGLLVGDEFDLDIALSVGRRWYVPSYGGPGK